MSVLSPAQQRELRARAHHLKPVVTIAGNGLSAAVLAEIDRSLQAHELIKIKLQGIERDQKAALLADLCAQLDAAAVQHIGNTLVVWRERRPEDSSLLTQTAATKKTAPRPATAKSAAAFAASARRAALARASALNTRNAAPRTSTRGR